MKKLILFSILSLFAFVSVSAQKMSKEAKKQAKAEAAAAANAAKKLAAEIATYEAEGWMVFGNSKQPLAEALKNRSLMKNEKIEIDGVQLDRYIVVTATAAHANNINSAFSAAKTMAHRDVVSEMKTVVETYTVNNQSSNTDAEGKVATSQSSSTIIDKKAEASLKNEKELLKLYRNTDKGKEAQLTLLVDLQDLYSK